MANLRLLIFALYKIVNTFCFGNFVRGSPAASLKNSAINNYPTVENLFEAISTFNEAKCLTVVENGNYINLHSSSQPTPPLILRRFLNKTLTLNGTKVPFRWAPANTILTNIPCTGNLCTCPLSKYLNGAYLPNNSHDGPQDICRLVEHIEFSSKSKPWSCTLQIHLFPRFDAGRLLDYSLLKIFNAKKPPAYSRYSFSSSIPPLQVFVLLKNSTDKEGLTLANWLNYMSHQLSWKFYFPPPDILIFIQASITSNATSRGTEIWCKVEIVGVLKHVPIVTQNAIKSEAARNLLQLASLTQVKTPDILSNLALLEKLAFPSPNENIIWFSSNIAKEQSTSYFILYFLNMCNDIPALTSKSFMKGKSFQERLGHAYAHIWLSIMKNYTLKSTFHMKHCWTRDGSQYIHAERYAVRLNRVRFLKWQYYFPYFSQVIQEDLRFVSCGQNSFTSIQFHELTSIFDRWTWILILVSTFIIKSLCAYATWLSPLKVFLEQGEPYHTVTLAKFHLRFAVGSFLLAGVVLSNSYKGNNVYNMILPRRLIPYQRFAELVNNNFTVLTRTAFVSFSSSWGMSNPIAQNTSTTSGANGKIHRVVGRWFKAFLYSELYYIIEKNYDNGPSQNLIENQPVIFNIWTNAWLSPASPQLFLEVVNLTKKETSLKFKIQDAIKQFHEAELDLLFNFLGVCKNIALILPQYLCNIYAHRLKTKDSGKPISIGKESYTEIDWIFTLDGFVPPHVIKTVKGVGELGIWKRWMDLANDSSTFARSEEFPVKAATITGNIIIVFVLFALGHFLAFVALVFESSLLCRSDHFSTVD